MRTVQRAAKVKSKAASKSNNTGNITSSLLPACEEAGTSVNKSISSSPRVKTCRLSTNSMKTVGNRITQNAAPSVPSLPSSTRPKEASAASSIPKTSRFTWVKSPNKTSQTSTLTVSGPSVQTPNSNRKRSRRLSTSPGAHKTSKYSWVSASCSTSMGAKVPAKPQHKLLSPKSPKMAGKAPVGKQTGTPVSSKRLKAGGGASASHLGHVSRYRWKALASSSPVALCTSTPKSSRRSSAYRWSAKGEEKNSGSPLFRVQQCTYGTKIVRRFSNR